MNPLISFLSQPGGGKSFAMDMIAEILHSDERLKALCKDPEMRDILSRSVAVPVSYNGNTLFTKGLDDEFPETGLVLRMLHRYLANCPFLI